jgi:hypothetical protein
MKNVTRVVIYYDDGTYQEVSNAFGLFNKPAPNVYTKPVSMCSKCGIQLDTFMGYVCGALDCPTGLGPVTCSN